MAEWRDELRWDPVPRLQECENPYIVYFTQRDLLDDEPGPIQKLWDQSLPRFLERQQENGSWRYPGKEPDNRKYCLVETYRNLGILIECYEMDRERKAVSKAAEYVFENQTSDGDIRGIYGYQYTPNYTAGFLELLTKAGYLDDPRLFKGFDWLKSVRQDDGGWTVPMTTSGIPWQEGEESLEVFEPDRSKPFSHAVTGIVLRAFAAHPELRIDTIAIEVGSLLADRFFKPDHFSGRADKSFWESVSYPFWFTDIVSSLDSLMRIGFKTDNARVNEALNWLRNRQMPDGSFQLKLLRTGGGFVQYWVDLAICRIFKGYYGES